MDLAASPAAVDVVTAGAGAELVIGVVQDVLEVGVAVLAVGDVLLVTVADRAGRLGGSL